MIVFQDKLWQAKIFMNCGCYGNQHIFGLALYLWIGDFYQCAKFHACIKKCTIPLKFGAKAPDYKRPLPPEETVLTRTYIKQCYKLFKIFNNLEVGQSFPGGSSVCSNASSRITHHSKDQVQGWHWKLFRTGLCKSIRRKTNDITVSWVICSFGNWTTSIFWNERHKEHVALMIWQSFLIWFLFPYLNQNKRFLAVWPISVNKKDGNCKKWVVNFC